MTSEKYPNVQPLSGRFKSHVAATRDYVQATLVTRILIWIGIGWYGRITSILEDPPAELHTGLPGHITIVYEISIILSTSTTCTRSDT